LYGKKRNSQKGKVIQKWKNKKRKVGKFINYAVLFLIARALHSAKNAIVAQ